MDQSHIPHLLSAAAGLAAAGRPGSAQTILDMVAGESASALQAAILTAAAKGWTDQTWLGTAALLRAAPEQRAFAETAWRTLVNAANRRGQLFDAAMMQMRLGLIGKTTPTVALGDRDPGLAYVLGMSLPHDGTGYAMRSQALAGALLAQQRSLVCLTRPGFPWDRGVTDAATSDTVDGVVYHRTGGPGDRLPRLPVDFLTAEATMTSELARLRPQRVMAASNHATAIPALFAARRLGLPFIYEVRGFWELSRVTRDPDYAHSPDYRTAHALEGAVAADADLVVTLTGAMRDELVRRGVARDRIVLLPNAADTTGLQPTTRDAALAYRLGLPEGVPVIGYIGSFTDYEGLEDLVGACADLAGMGHDFRLLIVGWDPRGENRIGPALRRMVTDLGIADRVILPGIVPRDEVPLWYSLIDIAPVPRRRFPVTELVSPLKPREAMAMGKAVVLSDLPPLAEMIRPGETGCLFPAGDRAALAQILARLVTDPERRKALGDAARRDVLTNHTWEKRAELCWRALGMVECG